MILYPLYYGYTGSDGLVSILRFTTVLVGIPIAAIAANLSSKLEIKWFPWIVLASNILFYGGFMLLTVWIPIDKNTFNLVVFTLTVAVYVFSLIFILLGEILQQRIFLDIIPDQNRNSVYSLIPTPILLASAPSVVLGGILLAEVGVPVTLLFLNLLGILGPIFFWIALYFLPKGALDSKK